MELSAETFARITGFALAGAPQSSDQRRRPRAGLDARATVIPLSGTHPATLSVDVRDLSAAGVGFLHSRKMDLDEQFALLLPRPDDSPAILLCHVSWWQPLARDVFAIGARFTRVLRDGGDPPLAVELTAPPEALAAEVRRLHRKAS